MSILAIIPIVLGTDYKTDNEDEDIPNNKNGEQPQHCPPFF